LPFDTSGQEAFVKDLQGLTMGRAVRLRLERLHHPRQAAVQLLGIAADRALDLRPRFTLQLEG
jgi:hypothetical protein